MVGVLSSISTGGNLIFFAETTKTCDVNFVEKCQICVVNKNLECIIYLFLLLDDLILYCRFKRKKLHASVAWKF